MSDSKVINFPSKWDSDSVGAIKFYEKCLPYVKETDDFYKITDISIVFNVISILSVVFILIVNLWLFKFHNNYLFKRQCVFYYVLLFIGTLIASVDCILIEVNFFY